MTGKTIYDRFLYINSKINTNNFKARSKVNGNICNLNGKGLIALTLKILKVNKNILAAEKLTKMNI